MADMAASVRVFVSLRKIELCRKFCIKRRIVYILGY